MTGSVTLVRHAEPLALAQLPPGADVPGWATSATLLSVTASEGQTTVLCHAPGVPAKVPSVGPLTAFRTDAGVLEVATPLAEAGVAPLTITTYDATWLLVPQDEAEQAERVWQDAGFTITQAASEGGDR